MHRAALFSYVNNSVVGCNWCHVGAVLTIQFVTSLLATGDREKDGVAMLIKINIMFCEKYYINNLLVYLFMDGVY